MFVTKVSPKKFIRLRFGVRVSKMEGFLSIARRQKKVGLNYNIVQR